MSIKEKLKNEISLNETKIENLVDNAIEIMERIKITIGEDRKVVIGDIYTFKSLKGRIEDLEKLHASALEINAENDKLKFILAEEK